MKRPLLPLTVAGLAALPALAPPGARADTFNLGEIVVSANLAPTEASKVGATVDVVTKADLQKAPQGSVAQALAFQPGITIRPNGGLGSNSGLSIRGVPQAYVKVLYDGIDVTDPSQPQVQFDFGRLTTAGLSRIEVLKGSQSALYGGSAVGGVIDIRSLHATEPGLHQVVSAEAGSRNTQRLSYGVTYKNRASDLALNLSHAGTDGIVDYVGSGSANQPSGYRSNRVDVNGSHTLASGLKLGFSAFHQVSQGHYDTMGSGLGTTPAKTGAGRVYAEFDSGSLHSTVAATAYRMDRSYNSSYGDYGYVGKRQTLSYKGTVPLGALARLSFGAKTAHLAFDQTYNAAPTSHGSWTENSAFTELSYSPAKALDLSFAARYDHVTNVGNAPSLRAAAAWHLRKDITLRASLGTGYRNPSPYELTHAAPGVALTREKSDSVDLGIEKRFADGSTIRATAFWFGVKDAIYAVYQSVPPYATNYYQQGSAFRRGVELEGRTKLGKVTLKGAYTYTVANASASLSGSAWGVAKYLPARNKLALSLSAPLYKGLSGSVQMVTGTDRATLPDYAVANARLSYDFGNRTEAYLSVENIFDAQYQLVQDYAQPGRSFYVGLRKSF